VTPKSKKVALIIGLLILLLLATAFFLLIREWPYDAQGESTLSLHYQGTTQDDLPTSLYFHLNRSAVESSMPILLNLFESARNAPGHSQKVPSSHDEAVEEFLRREAPPEKSWNFVEFEGNLYIFDRPLK
jgi:hypothetical protein